MHVNTSRWQRGKLLGKAGQEILLEISQLSWIRRICLRSGETAHLYHYPRKQRTSNNAIITEYKADVAHTENLGADD